MSTSARQTTTCVNYTWEIANLDHLRQTRLLSPQFQLPELDYGFWQLVAYPNESGPLQCGLLNFPVHTGPHETTVVFAFELLDLTGQVRARTRNRLGEFPRDNDYLFSFGTPELESSTTLTVKCVISLDGRDHYPSKSMSAVTEVVSQRFTDVIDVVDDDATVFEWEMKAGKSLRPKCFEMSFEKRGMVRICICYSVRSEGYTCTIISLCGFEEYLVSCRTSLLDTDGQTFSSIDHGKRFFFSYHEIWELEDVAKRMDLEDGKNYLKNAENRFRVRFDMELSLGETIHRQDKHPMSRRHIPGCEATLGNGLMRAYQNQQYCDWSISVDPQQPPIKVHKCILASRSPYFKAMLEGQMIEQESDQIFLHDTDYRALDRMIRFMYCNELHFLDDSGEDMDYQEAIEVYRVAHRCLLPDLVFECSTFLQGHVRKDNADVLRDFAELYEDKDLEKAVEAIAPRDSDVQKETDRYPIRSTRRN